MLRTIKYCVDTSMSTKLATDLFYCGLVDMIGNHETRQAQDQAENEY
jgi:hypothetical protein